MIKGVELYGQLKVVGKFQQHQHRKWYCWGCKNASHERRPIDDLRTNKYLVVADGVLIQINICNAQVVCEIGV